MPVPRRHLVRSCSAIGIGAALLSGCASSPESTGAAAGPGAPAGADQTPVAPATPGRAGFADADTMQATVIALGDEIVDLVVLGTNAVEAETTAIGERRKLHEIKLAVARSVTNSVAGPSSFAALVDLITKTELLARAADGAIEVEFGPMGRPLTDALERAQQASWKAADRLIPAAQVEQLRMILADWTIGERDLVYVAQVSVQEFVIRFAPSVGSESSRRRVSLLSFLALDPLAGLDPATRELQETRLLAERAFYQAQRTGRMLRWEAEGLLYDILAAGEIQSLLAAADRSSVAVESAAETLGEIPAVVARERAAAVADVDAMLTAQQEQFIADMESAVARQRTAAVGELQSAVATERAALRADVEAIEGPLQRTMESARETIADATVLSESLDESVDSFDALMARFGVDAREPRPERDPNRTPFDVSVYGATALDVGAGARDLTETFKSVEAVLNTPALAPGPGGGAERAAAASTALVETGTTLLNALLLRAAGLVVFAGVIAVGVIAIGRRLGRGGTG